MKGLISNIQRFSTQDGPGIRTTVFLKGCPLRCPWCHNMETWTQRPSLLYYDKDCARCGLCAAVCPHAVHALTEAAHSLDRARCTQCGLCARECPTGALELRGEWLTPSELLPRLLRDREFYAQSGGGVTFSGGEALLQFDFVRECIALAKQENLHVCLDTSGWGGRAHELAADVELYLWDVKHTDPVAHEALTGVPLAPILQSLRRVDASGGRTRLRCPIIPGINDTDSHVLAVADIANSLTHLQGVDLVPYHALGLVKSAALGLSAREYPRLTAERKTELLTALRSRTQVPAAWL